MGTVSLSIQNRLFWLGRYSERAYMTIEFTLDQLDLLIDGEAHDHREFCAMMGIPCPYESAEEFLQHYAFDQALPWSIAACVENMLGNGMVLRETISTPTLAYLQMAKNAMDLAAESKGPSVELQWIQDDIMAFRGSLDLSVETEAIENIVKAGGFVERLSLMLRVGWNIQRLDAELKKLLNALYKTELPTVPESLQVISNHVLGEKAADKAELLQAVENLFIV